jgi:hypothetical protein
MLLRQQKKRQQQLIMQIISLFALTVSLSLAFLFLLFPYLIKISGQINSAKYQPNQQQLKPQPPLLNAPPLYTRENLLKITGFATPESQIQFVINQDEKSEHLLSVGLNGEFLFNFDLTKGDNELAAYVIDAQGQKSDLTKTYKIVLDQDKPELELTEPASTDIVGKDKQQLTFKGQTEPKATVLINTIQGKADNDGKFEINYLLREGENKIVIHISDQAENSQDWDLTINYRP